MDKKYREAYFDHFDPSPRKESHKSEPRTVGSQPQEDEDDRGALYCLQVNLQLPYIELQITVIVVGST